MIFLGTLDPESIGPNLEFATHYQPTPVREAQQLLECIPAPLQETTFVDVGSGMGRMVMLAARLPFKLVVGLEISGALHEVARENLAHLDPEQLHCRDLRLVRGDAATYRFPCGRLAVYLYNPFRGPVMQQVLHSILSLPREVTLIYHTPVERDVIDSCEAFELALDLGFAAIYRRRPR